MKLTIDRATWLRGEGENVSRLLRGSDGKKCCLGFYCLAKGYTKEEIYNKASPRQLDNKANIGELMNAENTKENSICESLMIDNDDNHGLVTEETREKNITYSFEKIGVEVNFIH